MLIIEYFIFLYLKYWGFVVVVAVVVVYVEGTLLKF